MARAPHLVEDDANGGADAGHLLTERGYRWINEVPFNR